MQLFMLSFFYAFLMQILTEMMKIIAFKNVINRWFFSPFFFFF